MVQNLGRNVLGIYDIHAVPLIVIFSGVVCHASDSHGPHDVHDYRCA